MPENTRFVTNSVMQRHDDRGRHVTIQGTVVPVGPQVPSVSEVVNMEVEDSPFAMRMSLSSPTQRDIRRMLWDACRTAMGTATITESTCSVLMRNASSIRRHISAVEDATARAAYADQPMPNITHPGEEMHDRPAEDELTRTPEHVFSNFYDGIPISGVTTPADRVATSERANDVRSEMQEAPPDRPNAQPVRPGMVRRVADHIQSTEQMQRIAGTAAVFAQAPSDASLAAMHRAVEAAEASDASLAARLRAAEASDASLAARQRAAEARQYSQALGPEGSPAPEDDLINGRNPRHIRLRDRDASVSADNDSTEQSDG